MAYKIDIHKAFDILSYCLVRNLSTSMKNDILDFNVIKFFGINTRSSKVLCHLPVR